MKSELGPCKVYKIGFCLLSAGSAKLVLACFLQGLCNPVFWNKLCLHAASHIPRWCTPHAVSFLKDATFRSIPPPEFVSSATDVLVSKVRHSLFYSTTTWVLVFTRRTWEVVAAWCLHGGSEDCVSWRDARAGTPCWF